MTKAKGETPACIRVPAEMILHVYLRSDDAGQGPRTLCSFPGPLTISVISQEKMKNVKD